MTHVVFDDVFFCMGNSGIARYWSSVLTEWKVLAEQAGVKITVISRTGTFDDFGFDVIPFPASDWNDPFHALDRELVQRVLDDVRGDVYVPSYSRFALRTPTLNLVYDLIPEVFRFDTDGPQWLERKLALAASDRYVAISQNTATDFRRFYPGTSTLDSAIAYPGVDQSVFQRKSATQVAQFKQEFGLHNDYVVVPGTRYGANNYKNAGRIFDEVAARLLTDTHIVVTGGEGLRTEEILACQGARVSLSRLELDDEQLATAYSGAIATIYPSHYEGFGLPALESLACGTPVITNAGSSFPETVGDLGVFFDNDRLGDIARQIELAREPHRIAGVMDQGPVWAQQFRWESAARVVLESAVTCARNGLTRSPEVQSLIENYQAQAIRRQS